MSKANHYRVELTPTGVKVIAAHGMHVEAGALVASDSDGNLLLAYAPGVWSKVSLVQGPRSIASAERTPA